MRGSNELLDFDAGGSSGGLQGKWCRVFKRALCNSQSLHKQLQQFTLYLKKHYQALAPRARRSTPLPPTRALLLAFTILAVPRIVRNRLESHAGEVEPFDGTVWSVAADHLIRRKRVSARVRKKGRVSERTRERKEKRRKPTSPKEGL